MKRVIILLLAGLLTACAADPARVQEVAQVEADRLAPCGVPLSSFETFELAGMIYSDTVLADERKIAEADEFQANLKAKLDPLLAEWNAAPLEGAAGTLVIQPTLQHLKIVSGGARFWVGALAGDSYIDMDLALVNQGTGEEIAAVPIRRDADAMTGGWSVGKSDQNLDEYVASIVHEYLKKSY